MRQHYSVTLSTIAPIFFLMTIVSIPRTASPQPNQSIPAPLRPAHQERCANNASCPEYAQQRAALERTIVVLKAPSVAELLAAHPSRSAKPGSPDISASALKDARVHAATLKRAHSSAISAFSQRKIPVRPTYSIVMNALVVDRPISLEEASKILPGKVLQVIPNEEVSVTLDTSVPLIKAPAVWQTLDGKGVNVTGRGVRIGIIDTGIDYTHADLGGCSRTSNINKGSCAKVVGGYDFINNDNDPFDDHGHGTHCAATAAGKGALSGVAPDALLYAYKVLSAQGYGTYETIVSAVERAADPNKDGDISDHLDVISLSIGGGGGNPNDAASLALDRAVSLGIVPVVAAGNSGNGPRTINSPGSSRHAITVGAHSKDGQLAFFSSRGPVSFEQNNRQYNLAKPDIVAPGMYICAAASSGASPIGPTCLDSTHISISGTSMATPHVAGVAALVKQAHPDWSPFEIKSAIKRAASRSTPKENPGLNDAGAGGLDALAAVQAPRGQTFIEETYFSKLTFELSIRVPVGAPYVVQVARGSTIEEASASSWTTVLSGTSTAAVSDIAFSVTTLPQGTYIAKITSTGPTGAEIADYTTFEINRFALVSPLESDVVNARDPLLVELKDLAGSPVDSMVIEYSLDGGTFTTAGTSVSIPSLSGQINLPTLSGKTMLSVRTRVTTRGLEERFETSKIIVDPNLSAGFPVRVNQECGTTWWGASACQPNWAIHPVVADLDSDGQNEIIVWRNRYGAQSNEIQVYNGHGSLVKSFPLNAHPLQARYGEHQFIPRPLLVTDLDGDGTNELVIVESYIAYYSDIKEPTVVAVYDKNGAVRPGFPIILPGPNDSLITADLNHDGRKEIIVKNFSRTSGVGQTLHIIEPDGAIVADADLLVDSQYQSLTGFDEGRDSVVGNFDDDPDLEVAAFSGFYDTTDIQSVSDYAGVYILDWDQRGAVKTAVPLLSGMPFGGAGVLDSDSDGHHELTIPSTVFAQYSQSLTYLDPSNKPRTSSTMLFPTGQYLCPLESPAACGAYYSGTAIGRLKGETQRSLMAFAESSSPLGAQLHLLSGFSVKRAIGSLLTSRVASSPPIIRDITGDGENDIVMSNEINPFAPEYRGLVVLTSESDYTDSILFSTEKNFPGNSGFSPTVADIDNDGLLEVTFATLGDARESLPPATASKRRFSLYSFDTSGRTSVNSGAWSMWRGNSDHNGCLDCDGSIVASIEPAPIIIQHPKSRTINPGTRFTLQASAVGTGLSYQWEKASEPSDSPYFTGWYSIPGATGASLTEWLDYEGIFQYRVRVSSKTRQTISKPAVVTVLPPVEFRLCPTGAPKLTRGVCGCYVDDEDRDGDNVIDCIERRSYRDLGAAKITKLSDAPARYRVVLPNTPQATTYTLTATLNGSNKSRQSTSSRRTFNLSGLAKGTWTITWSATIQNVPKLSKAKGSPASLVVR